MNKLSSVTMSDDVSNNFERIAAANCDDVIFVYKPNPTHINGLNRFTI